MQRVPSRALYEGMVVLGISKIGSVALERFEHLYGLVQNIFVGRFEDVLCAASGKQVSGVPPCVGSTGKNCEGESFHYINYKRSWLVL